MTEHDTEFAKDLLRGAEEIGQFLYADRYADRVLRRMVYHLVAKSNLPVFKLGSMICARKSVLLWIKDQEERHAGENRKQASVKEEEKM
jgi:hypothetical protein